MPNGIEEGNEFMFHHGQEDRNKPTLDQIDLEYGPPTYRLGKIYSLIDNVSFPGKAEAVAHTVGNMWHEIRGSIEKISGDLGISNITPTAESSRIGRSEGVVVIFPEISCQAPNVGKVVIGSILTACIPPHHSKIWIRITHAGSNLLLDERSLLDR